LAIDPYFICAKAPEVAQIIRLSRDTNKSMPKFVVEKINMLLKGIDNPKIAAFGVTYKGNVDDVRESPSFEIVEVLKSQGFMVQVYDPHVPNDEYVDLDTAVQHADIVVILTDHNEYKNMDHKHIASLMKTPVLFDTRNIIKQQEDSGLTIVNYGNLYQFKK
jgi:UDP-N-acetyl-D-mannosaminuronic acid dehydrogenase